MKLFNYIASIMLIFTIGFARAASLETLEPSTFASSAPDTTTYFSQECESLTLTESRIVINILLFLRTSTLMETKAKLEKIANEDIPAIRDYMDQKEWSDIKWVSSIINREREYFFPFLNVRDVIKLFNSIYIQGEDYSRPALDMYLLEVDRWIELMDKAIQLQDICSAQSLPLFDVSK